MLTEVHFYDPQGHLLSLPLDGSSGYVVKNIDGLGPVKASIITSTYAGMPGGAYQTSKEDMRNVVFQLGLDPSYSSADPFGDLRRALYPWLSPQMKVEMHFLSSNFEEVKLIGYVESFEPAIFTAEPEVQISIVCPDPYFSAITPITGGRTGSGTFVVSNPGIIEIGFDLTLTIGSVATPEDVPHIELIRMIPVQYTDGGVGYYDEMTCDSPLTINGDAALVKISTVRGSKSALYTSHHSGIFYNTDLLPYMDGWIDILRGSNTFEIDYSTITEPVTVLLSFTPRYGGL
jgi:hypothetical protein